LSIWKKAVSVATSAALLASLLTAVAAPAAFASITQTSAGNVAQGTTSVGTATFLFTENSANALTTIGYMYVDILPALPGTGTVTWSGTPAISAPGSLDASVAIVGSRLEIRIRGVDAANVETISITGLKVKASADASPGAVRATLSDNAAGAIYNAFVSSTATASGKLAQAYGIGTTQFDVALDVGSCPFSGTNTVTVGSESVTITGVTADTPVVGQYRFTNPGDPFTSNHLANEVVTQTVPNCNPTALGAPATVVQAAQFTYSRTVTVFPGENNANAGDLRVIEPAAGFLAKGTTLTFTIATDGVVFSKVPPFVKAGDIAVSAPVLSADRKTVTMSVTTASTVASQVWLGDEACAVACVGPVYYDVAATVPGGTYVEVNLTLSGGLLVTGNPATNAIVFRGINASAPTPTVYIGENNQATGLVTLTEQTAGFFNAGPGNNNTLAVCTTGVNYSFTLAPWAKVTAGDLKLREGDVMSPDNIVEGKWDGSSCYTWTVWTASTVASTIQIGNSTFSSGPLINVAVNQAPGIVAMLVYSGNSYNYDDQLIATVGFAVAAFRNQVAVTALAQPLIPAGAVTKAGAIQIAETANGQLKANEELCFEIMPRGSAGAIQAKYDTLISALNTAQLPIVTASGGLVVGPVSVYNQGCSYRNGLGGPGTAYQSISFAFRILQQSTAGTGKLVVDNINLITLADAASGPVLFNVYGLGGSPTSVQFQAQVSNAKIGVKSAIKISAVNALGLIPNQGPWSTSTKVAEANEFITWKFDGGAALAGKTIRIYVAVKNSNGGWGPFVDLTGRVANAAGIAEFHWRSTNQWVSVRAYYPGDASYAPSWSSPVQGRWLS
jgi:hypothetical protein